MASQAQLNANRQNALKSTGPKTAEGKAAVSQNALKHGLFAHEAVIRGESQAEFELHRQAFLAEWCPVGATECMMAERIVSLSWRLRRAELMQNQAMDCMILRHVVAETDRDLNRGYSRAYGVSPGDPGVSKEYLPLGRVATKLWSDNEKLIERLFMHECRIESSLHKTITYLRKLQIMRRIEIDAAAERSAARTAEHQSPAEGTPATEDNSDLAKQTQFFTALMNARAFAASRYHDEPQPGRPANKANQSQDVQSVQKGAAEKRATQRAIRPITG